MNHRVSPAARPVPRSASGPSRHFLRAGALALLLAATGARAEIGKIPEGFTRLFNGKDLKGWHVSRTAHHGTTPKLTIKDGAVTITQQPFGQGGILLTDKKYQDFEFYVETDIKPGFNSGLFFRSTEEGSAYQVELDAGAGNNGNLLGEQLTLTRPTENLVPADQRVTVASVWNKDGWNSYRLRCEGEKPHLTFWVNDKKIWEYQLTTNDKPGGATDGYIALQFHFLTALGPSTMVMPLSYGTPGKGIGFRNMAVKELNKK